MVNGGQQPFIFYPPKTNRVAVQVVGSYHFELFPLAFKALLSIRRPPITPKMSIRTAAPLLATGPKSEEKTGAGGGATSPTACLAMAAAAATCSGGKEEKASDISITEGPFMYIAPTTPVKVFMCHTKDISENPYRRKVSVSASELPSALGIPGAYQSRAGYSRVRFYGEPVNPPDAFVQHLMAQGRKMEPILFNRFRREMADKYWVTKSGFLLDSKMPTAFGATPDGLVWDRRSGRFMGVLEIKYRDRACLSVEKGMIPLKYLVQIAGQLMCTVSNRFWYMEGKEDRVSIFEGEVERELLTKIRHWLLDYLELVNNNTIDTFPKRMKKEEAIDQDAWRKAFRIERIY